MARRESYKTIDVPAERRVVPERMWIECDICGEEVGGTEYTLKICRDDSSGYESFGCDICGKCTRKLVVYLKDAGLRRGTVSWSDGYDNNEYDVEVGAGHQTILDEWEGE